MAVTCLREHCTIKRKTRIDKFHVFDMEQEKTENKKAAENHRQAEL